MLLRCCDKYLLTSSTRTKDGRRALTARCPECGKKKFKILEMKHDRGLVRWVWIVPDAVPSNGITLTQEGADTLVPPAEVKYPEKLVGPLHSVLSGGMNEKCKTLRVNLPNRPNVEVLREDYVKAKTNQLREFGYDDLTSDHVDAQVTMLLEGRKKLSQGLTVIGMLMEREVIVPPLIPLKLRRIRWAVEE